MGSNVYTTFPFVPAGASGAQAAIDLSVVSPPTGLDSAMTFICRGQWEGEIVVEGSLDGVGFDPIASFRAGSDPAVVELAPITTNARVMFLRLFVRAVVGPNGVNVSLGAEQNCECVSNVQADQCPILSFTEESQKSQNAAAEVIVTEWSTDFGNLVLNLGPAISAIVNGIARSAIASANNFIWRLRIGGTPGAVDGAIVGSFAGAVGLAESLETFTVASFATPASGPNLVKLTLESSGAVGETTFIRGQMVQFSCPIVV